MGWTIYWPIKSIRRIYFVKKNKKWSLIIIFALSEHPLVLEPITPNTASLWPVKRIMDSKLNKYPILIGFSIGFPGSIILDVNCEKQMCQWSQCTAVWVARCICLDWSITGRYSDMLTIVVSLPWPSVGWPTHMMCCHVDMRTDNTCWKDIIKSATYFFYETSIKSY